MPTQAIEPAERRTDEGPAGLRIDRLAARLGLTKGSFQVTLLHGLSDELATVDPVDALRAPPSRLDELFDAELDRALRAWAIGNDGARAVVERVDSARLTFLETLWNRAVPDPTRARAAALLPHLLLIGANAIRPPLDAASRRALRSRSGPPPAHRRRDCRRCCELFSVSGGGPR
ncbi:hypothetical protein ACQPWW_16585 [Micromonospora sp. CA-240977]|uniref:hypothetical protein n=1 Tax=Micromonospora sp. CA-240977 TaxID=3239957 RepID=UPI003D8EBE65